MDEQDMMNQQAALAMGRTAYMGQDTQGINTLLNDLTNVDIVLDEVELILQGQVIDTETGKPKQVSEPLLNREGAARMRTLMRALTSRIVLMSNYEEQQVRVMTIELGNDLVEILTFNKVAYEMKHPKALAIIEQLVISTAFACAMSAMENGTRKMLRGTTMETTINTQGQSLKTGKGGGLGSLIGLGRKS